MRSRSGLGRLGALCILGGIVAAVGCKRADVFPLTASGGTDGGSDTTGGDDGIGSPLTVYVAPDGDDSNPGTLAQPLRTVARARDWVRTKNAAMTADITVYLRGGTYPQTSTLMFSSADSGSGGFFVKYVAYAGERPLVTGGQPIRGWKLFDGTNNIYSASASTMVFRQLYVNGVKAVRARSPNLGSNGAPIFSRLSGYDSAAHNLQVPSSQVANWSNLTKVEMHLMTAWADNTLRLASIATSGGTAYLKFQSPEDDILFIRPNPSLDQRGTGRPDRAYYFENALEMLDQAGEWYLDESKNLVYYKPRTGEDMATATVVAPVVETIMSVRGGSTSDQASYLWFQGLCFAHSTYMRPSAYGFLDAQAGQYNLTAAADNKQTVGRPAAGVTVINANHIRFERNMFVQMAATGLDLVSGTRDDTIVGNVFTQIGGSAISVGKFTADESTEYHVPYNPTDQDEICTNDTIANNYIRDVTTEIQGACGIAGGYPRGLDVEHNEIAGTNFTGISIGYGWTTLSNAMSNNKINYNNLHNLASLLAGGAAISTQSNQGPTSEMQYNYLHDFGQAAWADYAVEGVYLDEGTAGYSVVHNLMVNTPGLGRSPLAGANVVADNGASPSGADKTLATAGIEPSYLDIKDLTVPVAAF
jgi:hypothetical protein